MPAVTSTSSAPEERAGTEVKEESEADNAEERMWTALKRHIARERQRKKEEYEAEVEEERLRKEREARQRQDVMTLEETKEQIEQLEHKLKQLEKEKQQLFMQLKKVLNEDEIRKRQQAKESSEMPQMKMQMGNINIPMFLPPTSQGQGPGEPPPNQGRPPPLTSHMLNKSNVQPGGGGVKRARSPSPGPYAPHMYQHRVHHQPPLKHQPVYSEHAPPQHKMEDGRMGRQMARAVLWNKPTQYNTGPSVSGYYTHVATPSGVVSVAGERPPPLLYAHRPHTPHNLMYAPAPQPQLYLDMGQHRDDKKDVQPQVLIGLSEPHHAAGAGGGAVGANYGAAPPRHVTIHGNMGVHNNVQGVKPGSITQGYPVRQANPNVQSPAMYPNRHRY